MKYKIICSDLDGTLLNSSSELSPENLAAIEKITEMGYLFVPTTGRTLEAIPPAVRLNKNIRYIIYSNGVGIYDRLENKRYETLVEGDAMKQMLSVLKRYDLLCVLHKDGLMYLDKDGYKRVENYRVLPAYLKLFGYIPNEYVIGSFMDFLDTKESMEMLVVFFSREGDDEARCRLELGKIPGLFLTSSADGNIEIINEKANKGNAIKRLSKITEIPLAEFITLGDSYNDVEMLKLAGLSFATSGAKSETKAAAKQTICSNDEHVLKYLLENIL